MNKCKTCGKTCKREYCSYKCIPFNSLGQPKPTRKVTDLYKDPVSSFTLGNRDSAIGFDICGEVGRCLLWKIGFETTPRKHLTNEQQKVVDKEIPEMGLVFNNIEGVDSMVDQLLRLRHHMAPGEEPAHMRFMKRFA